MKESYKEGVELMGLLLRKKWYKELSIVLSLSIAISSFSCVNGSGRSYASPLNDAPLYLTDHTEDHSGDDIISEKLETPIDIYNYIRRNIKSEPGLKGTKSIDSIVTGKSATASENALLLSQMLRDRGYQTKYVYGNALLTERQIKWVSGKDSLNDAIKAYEEVEIDVKRKEQEDGSALFAVPHIWVSVYIPVTDYRCSGKNSGRYEWVELDAYVKNDDSSEIEELNLIPLSLPYEAEGIEEDGETQILDVISDDIYSPTETTENPTTEEPEDPTTEEPEDLTTEEPEDPTTEEPEDPTTEEPDDPTTEEPEDPTTEEPEDPTTEENEEPSYDGFFRVFDTKEEFITGDGQIEVRGNMINSNSLFSTIALDHNEYDLNQESEDAGVSLKKYDNRYLTWGNTYYLTDMTVDQLLDTQFDQQTGTYKGEYKLFFEPHVQPDAMDYYKDHAYAISTEVRSWTDAEQMCKEMGGHLVIINDAEENAYIRDMVNAAGKGGYVAIGYTDSENEGRWNWVAPTDSTFTKWNTGEPNDGGNFVSGGQDYAYMYEDGTWDDGNDSFHYYVCEWDNVDCVGTYELSTLTLVMEASDDLKLRLEDGWDVITNDLGNGFKQYIIKINISDGEPFVLPVEIDKEDVYKKLIKNVNLYYSTGLKQKDEKLGDVGFENVDYAEKGLWSAIIDSGIDGAVWSYLDIDALFETNSYLIYCAAASDDINTAAYYRYGDGRRIWESEIYSEQGIQDLVGRYLCLSIYVEPGGKMNVPYINKVTVGANTDMRPVSPDKEYLDIRIKGDDIIDVDAKTTYEFSAISNKRNGDDIVWTVNDEEVPTESYYNNYLFDFSSGVEGEYVLKAYYKDDPDNYAEKTVTVVRAENHDAKQAVNDLLKYPYFNMHLDKTSYYDGDDVRVITDIPEDTDVTIRYDQELYETIINNSCFDIENVGTGTHTLTVQIKNKAGNKFSKTITFNVYNAGATLKTWYDKDRYFSGDDVTLLVEDGYIFIYASIDGAKNTQDNEIITISEDRGSVSFTGPSSGNHLIDVKLIKEADDNEDDAISLQLYLFINDAPITSYLEDVVTVYDDDTTIPVAEIVAPSESTEIKGVVPIVCTVKDDTKLKNYTMKLCNLNEDGEIINENTIAEGAETIVKATVGEMDTDNLAEGTYKIILEALDMAGNSASSEVVITVTKTIVEEPTEEPTTEEPVTEEPTEDPTEEPENPDDKTAPIVCLLTPDDEETLTVPTDIIGSVYDEEGLSFWRLEYAAVDSTVFTTIAEGTDNTCDGVLGTLDTTMLMNGKYVIRLSAKDKGGNKVSVSRDVYVEGDLKVGNMHIGFTDLTENIGKAKISVNRIYDNRFKESGDFGYGWNMDISGMKLIENHPITDGYAMSVDGSAFNMTYRLYETLSHDVIVTYGDGTSDRFVQVINGGISSLIPVSKVSFSYRCITDPKKKLEILSDTTAEYEEGQLIFFDDDIYTDYDFKLTTDDGVIYYMNKTGVYRIEDTDGRVVNVDDTGYHGDDGAGIIFARDSKNRITSVQNFDGKTVTYIYDENGNLSEVTDTTDRTVKFTYDNDHNLISIIGPDGKEVSRNEYDDAGRLIATIDADGNRIEYSHDIDGREELITDRLGNSTLYVYDDNGNILSTTDANGNTTNSTYDQYGNVLTYKDAEGNVTTSSYDASGNLISVTDAEGNSISIEYNAQNRPVKLVTVDDAVMSISYDDKGNIIETADVDGSRISYERDTDGNVRSITDEIGKVMSSEYDAEGKVISTTDASGNKVEYTYDSDGHKLTETYNVVTSEGEVTRTIKYNYNTAGELISTEDPDGNISTVERDILGRVVALIDSEGRRTSYEYDKLGNTTKIAYPDGTSESFVYDAEGNLTSATGRTGNTAEYTYDKVGNLKKIHDARGNDTLYDYDRNYNLTAVTYATGAKISYKYDSLNRNTEVTDNDGNTTYFTYDSRSLLTSVTDAKGNVTRYEYNTKGERIKVIYPDETSASIELDVRGRVTAKIDTAGNRTEYTYDGSDRLISVKQPDGSVTEFTYDKTGNLLSFKDAKGRMTRYEYDDHQRVVKTTLPDGSYSTVSYDVFGYLVKATDPDGSVLVYGYDELGRPESVTKSGTRNAQNVSEKIEYSYDDYGRIVGVTDTKSGVADFNDINGSNGETRSGAASSADNIISSSVTYTYDEYGCITDKTYDNDQKVSYAYDDYGRCTSVSVTSAETTLTTGYEYDSMDRLTRVISHDGKATVYTYDENGNRSTATYANGVTLIYTYDECNRLKAEKVTDKNQNLIAQYEYTITGGERTAVSESYPDGTTIETEYSYDSCGRLVSENITEKKSGDETVTDIQYTYDCVGSRTSKTVNGITTEYDYNELNQLVSERTVNSDGSVSETVYTYDGNGNLVRTETGEKNCDYTYDLYNRMTGFTDGTARYSYTYDAEGVRRSKTLQNDSYSKTVMYVSDTLTEYAQTLVETDNTGRVNTSYTVGFELINSTRFNQSTDADLYYILDGHNDVRMLLDDSASAISSYRYSAYGEMLDFTGVVTDGYYYTGEYMDSETGLYYLRARYMDPAAATFTSMDSYAGNIYEPASLHRYLYANANPVKYCDPSGHYSVAEAAGTSAIQGECESVEAVHNATIMRIGLGLLRLIRSKAVVEFGSICNEELVKHCISIAVEGWIGRTFIDLLSLSCEADEVPEYIADARARVETMAKEYDKDKKYKGYSVYILRDPENSERVSYVGITNDPRRRKEEHSKFDPKKLNRKTKMVEKKTNGVDWEMYIVATGLSESEARVYENTLICLYGLEALGNVRHEIGKGRLVNNEEIQKETARVASLLKIADVKMFIDYMLGDY